MKIKLFFHNWISTIPLCFNTQHNTTWLHNTRIFILNAIIEYFPICFFSFVVCVHDSYWIAQADERIFTITWPKYVYIHTYILALFEFKYNPLSFFLIFPRITLILLVSQQFPYNTLVTFLRLCCACDHRTKEECGVGDVDNVHNSLLLNSMKPKDEGSWEMRVKWWHTRENSEGKWERINTVQLF